MLNTLTKDTSQNPLVTEDEQFDYEVAPANMLVPLNLWELWRYRGLLYFLLLRDLKSRYNGSFIGLGWLALQPLMLALIFSVVFSLWARMPTHDLPPLLFHLPGFLTWFMFMKALTGGTESISSVPKLITNAYFPRMILPLVKLSASFVEFLCGAVVLLVLFLCHGYLPQLTLLLMPFYLLLLMGFAAGLSLWLSVLNAEYPDIGKLVQSLTRMWMYLSPVVYSPALIPEKWQTLYFLNPVAVGLDGVRWTLYPDHYALHAPLATVLSAVGVSLFLIITGAYFFRYRETVIADVI